MTDHTSDCLLSSAPALAPTRCTCGASPAFKMFQYRPSYDVFGWEEHSRESLVAEVASRALAGCYIPGDGPSSNTRIRRSLLVYRATLDRFVELERAAISRAWIQTWEEPEGLWLTRHGILDVVSALDGSPIDPGLRAQLADLPTEGEVKACLAPWCEFWAKDWGR